MPSVGTGSKVAHWGCVYLIDSTPGCSRSLSGSNPGRSQNIVHKKPARIHNTPKKLRRTVIFSRTFLSSTMAYLDFFLPDMDILDRIHLRQPRLTFHYGFRHEDDVRGSPSFHATAFLHHYIALDTKVDRYCRYGTYCTKSRVMHDRKWLSLVSSYTGVLSPLAAESTAISRDVEFLKFINRYRCKREEEKSNQNI